MPTSETALLSAALAWASSVIPQIAAALALILAGHWLARATERALGRLLDRQLGSDPTLRGVLGSGARYAVLLLFLVAAFGQLGFQISSILAVLATAGLAVGLALQATLANIAAGIILLWLRPFRVGDSIEVGTVSGKVVEVGLFACEIHTVDGLYQFVPNSELWNKRLINLSRLERRLVAVRIRLKDVAAIERVRAWVLAEVARDPRVLADPAPHVVVSDLADDRITVSVQAWARTENYAALVRDISDNLVRIMARDAQGD